MPKVYPANSDRKMTGAEFRHIRVQLLDLTQEQLRGVVHRGIDRISSWENDRAEIPRIVAAYMRLKASLV